MLLTRLHLVLALAGIGLAAAWHPASAQSGLLNAGRSGLGSTGRALDDAGAAASDALRRVPVAPPLAATRAPPSAILGKLPPPPAPAARALPPLPPAPAAYDKAPPLPKVVYGALPGNPSTGAPRTSPALVGGFTNNRPGAALKGVPLPVKVDPAALRQAPIARMAAASPGLGRVALPRAKPVDVPASPGAGRIAAATAVPPTAVRAIRRIDASPPEQLSPLARQARSFEPLAVVRLADPLGPPSRYPKAGRRVLYGVTAVGILSGIGISVGTQVGDATAADPERPQ